MTDATNAKQSLTLANTAPGEGMFTGVAVVPVEERMDRE